MSRKVKIVNENITMYYGGDHAIGKWMDVTDSRYAVNDKDEQGEGYVFETSQVFPFGNNLIGLKVEDFQELKTDKELEKLIIDKCDAFIKTLSDASIK